MKIPTPPRFVNSLLSWLIAPHLREEILGDLHERFQLRAARIGTARARQRYWRDALAYMRPRFIKRETNKYPQPNQLAMIRTYLKIAWRNARFSKTFSLINGFGLTLGISCSLLVFLVIFHETNYDKHHKNAARIYRVETANKNDANPHPGTYIPLAKVLKEAPEFEAVVPIWNVWGRGVSIPASGDFFQRTPSLRGSGHLSTARLSMGLG